MGLRLTNEQIEAAHNHILATEKTAGVRWTKVQALEVLGKLWWLHNRLRKCKQVLDAIDCFGFDEWVPRR